MEWIPLLENTLWCGVAAVGFGVLLNVPERTLPVILLLGAAGGLLKFAALQWGLPLIIATFCGAALIGLLTIPFAHLKHAPPQIFAIPAVIPMVPGILAYQTMIGLLQLTGEHPALTYHQLLSETVGSGLRTLFILFSIAAGVAIPMLVTRKQSVKHLKIPISPFRKKEA